MEESEEEAFVVLESWQCGDRIRAERLWSYEEQAQYFLLEFIDRKPPGYKRDYHMYSCYHGNQLPRPKNDRWFFIRAHQEFIAWKEDIQNETLEENPDRELDLYLVELFHELFLHEKVRRRTTSFPINNPRTTFREMVLQRHEDIALIFRPSEARV